MKKPVYHNEIEQGTEEWLKLRLGIVTASEVNNILTPKGAPAKNDKMRTYACQIAAEREFGYVEPHFESYDMMRGHFEEIRARDLYNELYSPVKECGFITREINGITLGASPDGLVDDDGGIEIKARQAKYQVKTIISGEVPAEYMNQIQAVMLVSGRDWLDFISFSNGAEFFVKQVESDPERQQQIIDALALFEGYVQEVTESYKNKSRSLVRTERVEVDFGNTEAMISESE